MKTFKKKLVWPALIFLAGLLLGGGGLYGGARLGIYEINVEEEKKETPVPVSLENIALDADLSLFRDVVNIVKDKYFNIEEIEDQDLLYGAVSGIVGALDDPYSTFFNPSDAQKFEEDIGGRFGGIGAEIGIRDDQLLIISPLKGNPAEAVGLKAGDKILKVDDTFTNNLTIIEAVKIIRGEVGTDVTLLVFRDDWDEAQEFTITRATIVIPTLDWEMFTPGGDEGTSSNIAYIRLYNFNANAPQLFYRASFSALIQGAQGVVLDLRNNSGGFLEVANDIAGWFLERGDVIVKEKFRSGDQKIFRASGNSSFAAIPTVVLVNNGSASASEIVAGALRDNRGIKLIGETTFGKGTVQELEALKDGSSIKISVAEWLTPNGGRIEKKGLDPDIEITKEDTEGEKDPHLSKAIEVLESEIAESGIRTIFINL